MSRRIKCVGIWVLGTLMAWVSVGLAQPQPVDRRLLLSTSEQAGVTVHALNLKGVRDLVWSADGQHVYVLSGPSFAADGPARLHKLSYPPLRQVMEREVDGRATQLAMSGEGLLVGLRYSNRVERDPKTGKPGPSPTIRQTQIAVLNPSTLKDVRVLDVPQVGALQSRPSLRVALVQQEGSGFVYQVIDLMTGQVEATLENLRFTDPAGGAPHDVARITHGLLTPDGRYFIANGNRYRFNGGKLELEQVGDVRPSPMSVDGRYVAADRAVYRVENLAEPIMTAPTPVLGLWGDQVVMAGRGGRWLRFEVHDATTGQPMQTLEVQDSQGHARRVFPTPDPRRFFYLSAEDALKLVIYDEPPAIEVARAAPRQSIRVSSQREGDAWVTRLDFDPEQLVSAPIFTPDGSTVYLLEKGGVVHRVTLAGLRASAQARLGTPAAMLALARPGLLVAATERDTLLVLDPVTLAARQHWRVPGLRQVYSLPTMTHALVGTRYGWRLMDLATGAIESPPEGGLFIERYSNGHAQPVPIVFELTLTDDGNVAYTADKRFRLEGGQYVLEREMRPPVNADMQLTRPPYLVCGPFDRATPTPERRHYWIGAWDAADPFRLELNTDAYSPLALDPLRRQMYGATHDRVLAYDARGQRVASWPLHTQGQREMRVLAIDPAYRGLLLLSEDRVYWVELPHAAQPPAEGDWLHDDARRLAHATATEAQPDRTRRKLAGPTLEGDFGRLTRLDLDQPGYQYRVAWSADGRTCYLLDVDGLLFRVRPDTLESDLRLPIGQPCSQLMRTPLGLVVLLRDRHELWLIDEQTFIVKRILRVGDVQQIAGAPNWSMLFVHMQDGSGGVVDLVAGERVPDEQVFGPADGEDRRGIRVHGRYTNPIVTPDGRYLLCGGPELNRFRVEGARLTLEDRRLMGGGLTTSPDGAFLLTFNDNRSGPKHVSQTHGWTGYVWSIDDWDRPRHVVRAVKSPAAWAPGGDMLFALRDERLAAVTLDGEPVASVRTDVPTQHERFNRASPRGGDAVKVAIFSQITTVTAQPGAARLLVFDNASIWRFEPRGLADAKPAPAAQVAELPADRVTEMKQLPHLLREGQVVFSPDGGTAWVLHTKAKRLARHDWPSMQERAVVKHDHYRRIQLTPASLLASGGFSVVLNPLSLEERHKIAGNYEVFASAGSDRALLVDDGRSDTNPLIRRIDLLTGQMDPPMFALELDGMAHARAVLKLTENETPRLGLHYAVMTPDGQSLVASCQDHLITLRLGHDQPQWSKPTPPVHPHPPGIGPQPRRPIRHVPGCHDLRRARSQHRSMGATAAPPAALSTRRPHATPADH